MYKYKIQPFSFIKTTQKQLIYNVLRLTTHNTMFYNRFDVTAFE